MGEGIADAIEGTAPATEVVRDEAPGTSSPLRARSKSFDDAMAAVIKEGIVKPTKYPYIYPTETTEVIPKLAEMGTSSPMRSKSNAFAAAMAGVSKEGIEGAIEDTVPAT